MDQREEESQRTWVGNMNVVGRCPTHGYTLQCACNEVFGYVPSGENSCQVGGKSRALCPKCHTTWNQKDEPRFTVVLKRYVVMLQKEQGDNELVLVGVGQARDAGAMFLTIYSKIESANFTGLSILEVGEEQYEGAAMELMARKRQSEIGGFIGFMMEMLGDQPDEEDPHKKRRRKRDH